MVDIIQHIKLILVDKIKMPTQITCWNETKPFQINNVELLNKKEKKRELKKYNEGKDFSFIVC
jgi:hypothetical protein